MASYYDVRLCKLEKQAHRHDNPVLIVNEAEDGTYRHDDGRLVTQKQMQRAQVVVIDDIGAEGDDLAIT